MLAGSVDDAGHGNAKAVVMSDCVGKKVTYTCCTLFRKVADEADGGSFSGKDINIFQNASAHICA